MKTNKIMNDQSILSSFPSNLDYTTDNPRFDNKTTPLTTMAVAGVSVYGVFVSADGTRTGSYSITSRQKAYLLLNSSFQSKLKNR